MKKLPCFLIAFLIIGCGGGGGETAPPSQFSPPDITGTYKMTEYDEIYRNISGVSARLHTPDSFSGTMTVGRSTFTQINYLNIGPNDNGVKHMGEGSYTLTDNTGGTLHISIGSSAIGDPTLVGDGSITLSGKSLITYTGEMPRGAGTDNTLSYYFYWTRE